ncbi:hypothetical protein [Nocardia sp. NPDC019395]|uniref:hypothetical protein n=1 Tax=Nocardia sp. NPDC019395 TaxID=3154686 RepID=UPI0033D3725B
MTSWLPLIGSLLIASVTLIGITINNRTNNLAIAAAEEREHRKWQREAVLRLCGEAVETALHAQADYDRLVYDILDEVQEDELRKLVEDHARKLGATAAMLHMLNARLVGDASAKLQAAVTDSGFRSAATALAHRAAADEPMPHFSSTTLETLEKKFEEGLKRLEAARMTLTQAAGTELRWLNDHSFSSGDPAL